MVVFPHAKVNLGLRIHRRRADGFHDIESVFVPIDWCDVLEFTPLPDAADGTVEWEQTGIVIPPDGKDNLCIRAYRLLCEVAGPLPAVHMHLHKVIPTGAGLGGGSADAAFVIRTLDRMHGLNLGIDAMRQLAARLGSDCAFFITDRTCLATGRGEILEPVEVPLAGLHIAVVHPAVHVGTAEAYASVTPSVPEQGLLKVLQSPIADWQGSVINDFEEGCIKRHPVIGEVKQRLLAAGAAYTSMTGSGSSVYGLFTQKPHLDTLFPGMAVHVGRPIISTQ
jgi:4-diphosphocytidyl-2-C-methyl-D-erythritol kinase